MIFETIFWLTLNLYHEARGEPPEVQMAVAHVTMNRALDRKKTVSDVVKEPYQFSWTTTKLKQKPWVTDSETFLRCGIIALTAIIMPDITKGSTYYHERKVEPYWAKKMTKTKTTEKFYFYKEKKS